MVIGWFLQGRMEFGLRATGNRSILGDARSPKMQSVMNLKVKFRESFRPFAPIVRRDASRIIFELSADLALHAAAGRSDSAGAATPGPKRSGSGLEL